MGDIIADEPVNPSMTKADLAALKRLNEQRETAKKIKFERMTEAKRKRLNKAEVMRRKHTELQDFVKEVFEKHSLPLDKWGHFYVTGAYTSGDIPGGNPQFNDNDYRIALMIDLSEKIRGALGDEKVPVVESKERVSREVSGIPDQNHTQKQEVNKVEGGV